MIELLTTAVERALAETDDVDVAAGAASALFSIMLAERDQFNKVAQAILEKTMKAGNKISAICRRDLAKALRLKSPVEMGREVIRVIGIWRTQLANLLTASQLASLLEGARGVVGQMPVFPHLPGIRLPPTLPPTDATKLLEELRQLAPVPRANRIYGLPAAEQEFVNEMLRMEGPPSFPFIRIGEPEGEERILWPVIEESVRDLSTRNAVTRPEFDALTEEAKHKAFTIAGIESHDLLGKMRDLLAKNVAEGVSNKGFRNDALAYVGSDEVLTEAHLELVFRANVSAAYSDGQMKILEHPFIASGFPYAAINPIPDDRVRHDHLALKYLGLNGTNIYRINDPVFQEFRGPFDFG